MTVGPDYQVPTAPVMPDYLEYEDPLLDTTAPVAPEWWKTAFKDPILDRLVETALAQNLSLRSAGLRVLQARQQLLIAIGNQYPQQQQLSGQAGIEGVFSSPAYEIYDLGFNLAWEADVWGRFKRQIESASAALDASVGSYDGVMVSLIAQVAQTYLLIRTTQQRLAVAETQPRASAGERADHHREVRRRRGQFPRRRPGPDPVLQHPGVRDVARVVAAAVQELARDPARPAAVRHERNCSVHRSRFRPSRPRSPWACRRT